jgi:hypothetical protein
MDVGVLSICALFMHVCTLVFIVTHTYIHTYIHIDLPASNPFCKAKMPSFLAILTKASITPSKSISIRKFERVNVHEYMLVSVHAHF